MSESPYRVLFLCTGNACRSQMAEGWARHLAPSGLAFRSAGIEAHGQNQRALAVMREAGVDISGQASTPLTEELLGWADRVVTVCGHADEQCPVLPPETTKEHWALADPARATGTEDEILAVFRGTRDEVEHRVRQLIHRLQTLEANP